MPSNTFLQQETNDILVIKHALRPQNKKSYYISRVGNIICYRNSDILVQTQSMRLVVCSVAQVMATNPSWTERHTPRRRHHRPPLRLHKKAFHG